MNKSKEENPLKIFDIQIENIKPDSRLVLTIDDDQWIQKLILRMFKGWGLYPISALDPYNGLHLAIKYRPLVILLDLNLPDVKGLNVLKMLKAIEITNHIPVLILSANINKNILSDALKFGANGFISKPFKEEILFQKIRQNLDRKIAEELEYSA